MQREELLQEIRMSYYELTTYLIGKYGPAQCDYFYNETCRSRHERVSRTAEGLICHHIFEDRGTSLSRPFPAMPYEWQRRENLVYCNELEHLLLHIKIAVLRQKHRLQRVWDIRRFFTTYGIYQISQAINDMITQNGTSVPYKQRLYAAFKENYTEYVLLLKLIMQYIDSQYVGIKDGNPDLDTSDKEYSPLEQPPDDYYGYMDFTLRGLCSEYPKKLQASLCVNIYQDVLRCAECDMDILVRALAIDYRGYGFPQFTDCELDFEQYGAHNVDEYISNAMPSYLNPHFQIESGLTPHFWTGSIPRKLLRKQSYEYIVRIRVRFEIKDGETPFVWGKAGLYNFGICIDDENNNQLFKSGVLLSTSKMQDESLKQRIICRNSRGAIMPETVILSLTRADFALFKERYKVRNLRILDGCYFQ